MARKTLPRDFYKRFPFSQDLLPTVLRLWGFDHANYADAGFFSTMAERSERTGEKARHPPIYWDPLQDTFSFTLPFVSKRSERPRPKCLPRLSLLQHCKLMHDCGARQSSGPNSTATCRIPAEDPQRCCIRLFYCLILYPTLTSPGLSQF